MSDQLKPPLWRVMHDALPSGKPREWMPWNLRAAELRALADWLVPAEPRPDPNAVQPGGTRMYYNERLAMWYKQLRLRQLLLDEADRADAGE